LAELAAGATPVASPIATAADDPALAAFTPTQRFFIAAATVWREKIRDAALVTEVKSDSHSPSQVRGVQPLRNMAQFFDAFHIVPGDPMYLPPDQRVVIW
ncbi:MAG TPA: M13-type metalloendopeptidase, partial [Thermomicrobiales bacterium]|nr:M13-type metalloendopeptidase [Thermomicrobiales bacterium]